MDILRKKNNLVLVKIRTHILQHVTQSLDRDLRSSGLLRSE